MKNISNPRPKYVVGVSIKDNSKTYSFDSNFLDLRVGDECTVETEWGEDIGMVVVAKLTSCCKKNIKHFRKVLRKATKEDIEKSTLKDEKVKEAFQFCERKIEERKIPMKLFRVTMNLDRTRARFYFTAEGRVDFRALLRDLSQKLRMKIEMRQIGVRDEAKLLGGCGPCGEKLCCVRFLKDFEPVSIRMAKNQDLALNPFKITGVCGRLLCCLIYENEVYTELKKSIPKNGKIVKTPEGEGKVINSDTIQQKVYVELKEEGRRAHFLINEIEIVPGPKKVLKLSKNGDSQ